MKKTVTQTKSSSGIVWQELDPLNFTTCLAHIRDEGEWEKILGFKFTNNSSDCDETALHRAFGGDV